MILKLYASFQPKKGDTGVKTPLLLELFLFEEKKSCKFSMLNQNF